MNRFAAVVYALVACAMGPSIAPAQQAAWPTRPIRLVVPVSAGGGLDFVARLMAEKASEHLGQPILVVNQAGAGGTIAAAAVAKSEPDGYTMLFQSVSGAVATPVMLKDLNYDPVKDFAAVSLVARFPLVMVTSPTLPSRNIQEFIALLKANPGQYAYASTGVGTALYVAAEMFKLQTKTDIVNVPYKGTADVFADLTSGRVAMLIDGLPPQMPNIQAGSVRAMAVTSPQRSPALPDVPAMAEILPGFDMPFWTGVFAPASTPKPVVDRMAGAIAAALKHPDVVRRLTTVGSEPVGSTPEELKAYWDEQMQLYRKIIREAGLKPN